MRSAGGVHRMELSGGLVLGLQPVARKSRTVVHCQSEWPVRVQCDGQPRAAHTGPLYQAFLDSFSVSIFLLTHSVVHANTHTLLLTQVSFFFFTPLPPRDNDVAGLASAARPDIVIANSR